MTKNTLGHLWKQNEEINNAISITTMEDENYESGNMVTPKRSQQNCMILPIWKREGKLKQENHEHFMCAWQLIMKMTMVDNALNSKTLNLLHIKSF